MQDFVAIDFETANGRRSSVCSVGIVIVRGGEIVDKFYSLFNLLPIIIDTGLLRFTGSPAGTLTGNRHFRKYGLRWQTKSKGCLS